MQIFDLVLVLLACVIASAVLGQLRPMRRIALPLVQIGVGLVVALLVPPIEDVHVSSELFLVLFIAPLLFNEARSSNRKQLWRNKGSILSLAVGLVLLTVLAAGYALHFIVPSIPLAAAFACAAALAPTDAAAVESMSSTVTLGKRQSVLLSGEALLNDASGVVSFHFAIAAALTGTFSLVDAGESFAVLFFGGILAGAVLGSLALFSMRLLRRYGYESTTVHVIYEVFTPFAVYLLANRIGVSGILAVVVTGLIMAEDAPRLLSADAARRQMVSNSFWTVIVFLINGVIFIMLGMELPMALSPALAENFSVLMLVAIVVAVTVLIMACRFVWLFVMELVHRARARRTKPDGKAAAADEPTLGALLRSTLIMTVGAPKGAITLSIIFTIPLTLQSGADFPQRDLIIFLTAGVVLCSLLVANVCLPLIVPKRKKATEDEQAKEEALRTAAVKVLQATIAQMQEYVGSGEYADYVPALRVSIARYSTRLERERRATKALGKQMDRLSREILKLQHARVTRIEKEHADRRLQDAVSHYAMLREVRSSVGYYEQGASAGSHWDTLKGQLALLLRKAEGSTKADAEESEQVYYDACLLAIDLEKVAIDYLTRVADGSERRKHAAEVMLIMHRIALESLQDRVKHLRTDEKKVASDDESSEDGPRYTPQFIQERRYADEVDANALLIELDQVRTLLEEGEITEDIAQQLRERIYVMQISLGL